jgi:hypothetical protein
MSTRARSRRRARVDDERAACTIPTAYNVEIAKRS